MSDPTPPLAPSPERSFFRTENGIRPGWRVALFFLLILAEYLVLFAFMFLLHAHGKLSTGMLTPLGLGITEGTILLTSLGAALIMSRIEHRRFADYGLPLQQALRSHFWTGALIGFLSITACLLIIFAFRGFHVTGIATSGRTLFFATLAWSLTFLIVGLAEEFAFRGYLQFTFTTAMGFWPAAFLTSGIFGLAHAGNPGESKFGLVSVVCFGLLFCLFLRRTGNLWWAVGFHAGWDWGQTFFYGVRDSGAPAYHNFLNSTFSGPVWLTGGSVGPEASLFTPLALAIVAILFSRRYRESR